MNSLGIDYIREIYDASSRYEDAELKKIRKRILSKCRWEVTPSDLDNEYLKNSVRATLSIQLGEYPVVYRNDIFFHRDYLAQLKFNLYLYDLCECQEKMYKSIVREIQQQSGIYGVDVVKDFLDNLERRKI